GPERLSGTDARARAEGPAGAHRRAGGARTRGDARDVRRIETEECAAARGGEAAARALLRRRRRRDGRPGGGGGGRACPRRRAPRPPARSPENARATDRCAAPRVSGGALGDWPLVAAVLTAA